MTTMKMMGSGRVRVEFLLPARGLVGFRGEYLSDTRGQGIVNTLFAGWKPYAGHFLSRKNGSMVCDRKGQTTAYALFNLQPRGKLFVGTGTDVYEGMIVGENSRENDLNVNATKAKQLTNVRSAGADEKLILAPPVQLTLEKAMEFIAEDELMEVTPQHIRLRKRVLAANMRSVCAASAKPRRSAAERTGVPDQGRLPWSALPPESPASSVLARPGPGPRWGSGDAGGLAGSTAHHRACAAIAVMGTARGTTQGRATARLDGGGPPRSSTVSCSARPRTGRPQNTNGHPVADPALDARWLDCVHSPRPSGSHGSLWVRPRGRRRRSRCRSRNPWRPVVTALLPPEWPRACRRFTEPRRHPTHHTSNHAAERVALSTDGLEQRIHLRGGGGIGTPQRMTIDTCAGDVRFIDRCLNPTQPVHPSHDLHRRDTLEHLLSHRPRRDPSHGLSRTRPTAALPGPESMLGMVGQIGMGRTIPVCERLVGSRVGILVPHDHRQGRAQGASLEHTRQDLNCIGFLAVAHVLRLPRTPTGERRGDPREVERNARRTSIDDHAQSPTMALTKGGDRKQLSECGAATRHLTSKPEPNQRHRPRFPDTPPDDDRPLPPPKRRSCHLPWW